MPIPPENVLDAPSVLCLGDSLTWGQNPRDGSRFPYHVRWPGVLQRELNRTLTGGARVIEEGLCGRTVATESWLFPMRSARSVAQMLLETHAPLSVVIVLLGVNDTIATYRRSVPDVALSCYSLLMEMQRSGCGVEGSAPKFLLVAPPPVEKPLGAMELFFRGAAETSRGLASAYATIAATCGASFFDSSTIVKASELDGVHIDEAAHELLGVHIATQVRGIIMRKQ
ncbi:MAG: GDSL-type esterase/lipase family protein [Phycisphaerae bacterium]|nr:GDSL-type esterase/lipase family protein [Phycisphaerae bacterium]